MIDFVIMDLMLVVSGVFILGLIFTHSVAIFLGVVVARHLMNAVVLVHMVLMQMVAKAMVEMGMVLNLMVLMVVVGMFEYMFMPFNTSRVILERLDLVDLPTIWPWPLHFSLPELDL